MGCELGLQCGVSTNLNAPAVPDNSVSRDHYLTFFKSAGSKRVPESGMFVSVYKPNKETFDRLVEPHKKSDPNLSELWPIKLNTETPYQCLGCFDTSIANQLIKGEIPEGTCAECPYKNNL